MIGWIEASYMGLPIIYIYICTVRSEMDFGPVNFPAVCDSLMECVSIIQKRWPLTSCMLTQQAAILNFQQATALLHTTDSWEGDIHKSPQIQRISLDEPLQLFSCLFIMFLFFHDFNARVIVIEDQLANDLSKCGIYFRRTSTICAVQLANTK